MRASLVKLGLSMAAISGPAGTIVACFCRRLKRGRMRKKNDCDAMQTAGSRQQAIRGQSPTCCQVLVRQTRHAQERRMQGRSCRQVHACRVRIG
jgi:hypothetical protein